MDSQGVRDGLLGPVEVRELAHNLGLRPTKKLGQNFVIDPNTIRKIVSIPGLKSDDIVLEVGPGLGSLTLGILPEIDKLIAIELDVQLASYLSETIKRRLPDQAHRLQLIHGDAMTVTKLPQKPSVLVANLPYNVSVPIFLHVLESFPSINRGVILVQKEVAERLTAQSGNKVYGIPTLKAQWYAKLTYAGTIGKKVFWPAPNVSSGLVSFTRHPENAAANVKRADVFSLIDIAFSQRRKTMKTAVNTWNKQYMMHKIDISHVKFDLGQRPEQLTLQDFISLMEIAYENTPFRT